MVKDVKADIQPTGKSREEIEQIAKDFAKKYDFNPEEKRSHDLASQLLTHSIEVMDYDKVDDPVLSGHIDVRGKGDFTISLSPFTSETRDNFTVAHELGHYVLHSEYGTHPCLIPRKGSSSLETEANHFAAGLLMPERRFKQLWNECNKDLGLIAASFQVSREAAGIRAEALDLK